MKNMDIRIVKNSIRLKNILKNLFIEYTSFRYEWGLDFKY